MNCKESPKRFNRLGDFRAVLISRYTLFFFFAGKLLSICGGFRPSLMLIHCIVSAIEHLDEFRILLGVKHRNAACNAYGNILSVCLNILISTFVIEFRAQLFIFLKVTVLKNYEELIATDSKYGATLESA